MATGAFVGSMVAGFLGTFIAGGSPQGISPLNIERLVDQSGMIFAGKVIGVETGRKDQMNLYVTYYTFEVTDALFGVETDTVRIKQYGGEADGRSFYPEGVPRFKIGEELLVMLYPPSKVGMTSTVGKGQGKFLIQDDDSSRIKQVANAFNNKGLFRRLRYPGTVADESWAAEQPTGPLGYEAFVETIRDLIITLKKKR
ncbi:MAG: hypothetical protein HYW57_02725 [Ignavibacteriales bacterium]|nr:hypothetical protein [Ignavibacteriales bacterium]